MKIRMVLALCLVAWPIAVAQQRTPPFAVNLDELEWGPPIDSKGVPRGARTVRQGVDPVTKGVTYYAMFPAGTRFDPHWHTHDEYVVVARGAVTLELGDETRNLRAGAYAAIPGGMRHSWHVPDSGEVVILVRRAGPADFNFIE